MISWVLKTSCLSVVLGQIPYIQWSDMFTQERVYSLLNLNEFATIIFDYLVYVGVDYIIFDYQFLWKKPSSYYTNMVKIWVANAWGWLFETWPLFHGPNWKQYCRLEFYSALQLHDQVHCLNLVMIIHHGHQEPLYTEVTLLVPMLVCTLMSITRPKRYCLGRNLAG